MATTNNITVSVLNVTTQKASLEAEYSALVAGINAELANVTDYVINGVAFSKAELIAQFQGRVDAAQTTKKARTALQVAVAAEREMQVEAAPLRAGFKGYLSSRFGKNSPELQKFGFAPAKKPQKPVASKAAGIAKGQATRQARHTTGKKAKLKVKGTAQPAPAPASPPAAKAAATASSGETPPRPT